MAEDVAILSLVEELAIGLMPSGLNTSWDVVATPPELYRQQAQVMVDLLKNALTLRPDRLTELGWQRIGLRSEDDRLARTRVLLFAPPERRPFNG